MWRTKKQLAAARWNAAFEAFTIFADADHVDTFIVVTPEEKRAAGRLVKAGLLEQNPTNLKQYRRTQKGDELFTVFVGRPRPEKHSKPKDGG